MEEPITAAKIPHIAQLKRGEYYWCACGRSNNQPFCDGSHKGSSFNPVKFEVTQEITSYLCMCKRSAKKPFCDGTHKSL